MATFKICVFYHQRRKDNKYPVSIKIYWKKQQSYIHTEYYVSDKQVKKSYHLRNNKKTLFVELKDPYIINELNSRIVVYEKLKAEKLRHNIELYNAKELAEYFKREGAPGTDSSIDFIEFAHLYCSRLIARGRKTTASRMKQSINALIDFNSGDEKIGITNINIKFLNQFDNFLRSKRTMQRKNQFGRVVTIKRGGLSDVSVNGYMADVRTFFNAAIDEYNDEDKGDIRIKHYPFRKYEFKKGREPDKRNLSIEQIRSIMNVSDEDLKHERAILGRDVFMLSFFLAGVNTCDLYDRDKELK